jgi:hypothetical protein
MWLEGEFKQSIKEKGGHHTISISNDINVLPIFDQKMAKSILKEFL